MYTALMNNARLVFEATKMIESHLKKEMSIRQLADKIGYSLYHFIRLFQGVVGCSPGEYLGARRLSRAAQEILAGDKKVIQIALDYQFSSPEAFSRAFKKHTGMSPTAFRNNASLKLELSHLPWIAPYQQDLTTEDGKPVDRSPEIVELQEILLAGRMIEVKKEYSAIGHLWNTFIQLAPPAGTANPPEYAQCSFWDQDQKDDSLFVMAAFQVNSMGLNDAFVYKQIPPARYLRFPHYGPCHRIQETYYWLFANWLPTTQHRLTLPFNLELYPAENDPIREKNVTAWILLPLEKLSG